MDTWESIRIKKSIKMRRLKFLENEIARVTADIMKESKEVNSPLLALFAKPLITKNSRRHPAITTRKRVNIYERVFNARNYEEFPLSLSVMPQLDTAFRQFLML